MKTKILSLVGARPNFIKIAPLHRSFAQYKNIIEHKICHTGQHFDNNMSQIFFDELGLPEPDFYLGVGGGTHTTQTAEIMVRLEKILETEKPDLLIVPGDVNSTMAGALTASKMGIPLAHVEAGLRSFDRTMPEEINRMVTDVLADYLFVSEKSGLVNLKKEGIADDKVFFVGNIMIDSLVHYLSKIRKSAIYTEMGVNPKDYILVTFHRPSNVDHHESLSSICGLLNQIAEHKKVIFPVHPRTRKNLESSHLISLLNKNILLSEPIGYIDFLALVKDALLIITDSGGIQEETTFLGVPCITVRDNTERPVTVDQGTNLLAGTDFTRVHSAVTEVLNGQIKKGSVPELWDGKTADRITDILVHKLV